MYFYNIDNYELINELAVEYFKPINTFESQQNNKYKNN